MTIVLVAEHLGPHDLHRWPVVGCLRPMIARPTGRQHKLADHGGSWFQLFGKDAIRQMGAGQDGFVVEKIGSAFDASLGEAFAIADGQILAGFNRSSEHGR